MQTENTEVKNSIYAGISIYKTIKNSKIQLEDKFISQEDKKYLSLYLGILNTTNQISDMLKRKNKILNIHVYFDKLEIDEYVEIYQDNFIDILNKVDFESLNEYINYLLTKDVVKDLNRINNIQIEEIVTNSNKQLIKK